MRPSLESLRTWLAQSPRTLGWNAIVAYDRGKTNEVLLQEYIGRFSTDSYFPPMDGMVPTTENEVEWIYDFLVDAPRLSFENANITTSQARLTMTVMGGAQIGIRQEPGAAAQVSKVSSYNALQGPKYTADIDLRVAAGSVDSAGRVELDLGTGANPLLYFGPTANQRSKGGVFFRNKLNSLEPEIKVFVLNEMGSQAGQFLQPQEFVLRTHAEPGAREARAANYGEGAVLLFVTMKGEKNGTVPVKDEDMQFLIPAGDYSATVLLGQRFLVERLVVEGVSRLPFEHGDRYNIRGPAEGFAEGIDVQAYMYVRGGWFESEHYSLDVANVILLRGDGWYLFIDISRDQHELRVRWNLPLVTDEGPYCIAKFYNTSHSYHFHVNHDFSFEQEYRFLADSGNLRLAPGTASESINVTPGLDDIPSPILADFEPIRSAIAGVCRTAFNDLAAKLDSVAQNIDVFRLNSLLFRGDNIVSFTHVEKPGDLLVLGELAPSLTRFAISPLEPRVGAGGQVQFRTEPEVPGASWRVDHIAGGTGATGTVDASGKYTAPPKDQVEGFFKRVRVTASKDGHSSSALVTVLPRGIQINPIVQICGASSGSSEQTRELAAGSLDGRPLTWSVVGTSGASVRPSAVEGGDHTFVAGLASAEDHFTMEEVRVRDASGQTDSAWVVVVHKVANAKITFQPLDPPQPGKVQLLIDMGAGPLTPDEAIGLKVEWKLLKGGGTLGATGIYQEDPASPYRFAVIVGFVPPLPPVPPYPPYPPFTGYMILPLPVVKLPELRTALERTDAYFKAVPALGEEQAARILSGEA